METKKDNITDDQIHQLQYNESATVHSFFLRHYPHWNIWSLKPDQITSSQQKDQKNTDFCFTSSVSSNTRR